MDHSFKEILSEKSPSNDSNRNPADDDEQSEMTFSKSNIIGTHPTEVITSIHPENGYPIRQENGQRKMGPPPDWPTTRHPPGRGCEVFVGKLPRDCFESELFPLFERCGQIYEMRLMMDFSGFNRGYAFITFTNRDDAKKSVKELNNYEIRPNRLIGVCQSVDNCRLFVGGIPKSKKREEILEEMCKITEGVVDVIVYPSAHDKTKNRGFAFVEYESHRSAAMARRKLLPGKIQLWGHQIAVDWAEPEAEVDEDVMATVRVLYVRNLMMTTTEEQIKEIFEQFKPNSIERVKKLKDYAFVHFRERDDALHAMNRINGREIDGSIVEVTLAKPVDKNQYFRFTRGVSPSNLTTNISLGFPINGTTTATAVGASGNSPFELNPPFTTIPCLTLPSGTPLNHLTQKNVRRTMTNNGNLRSTTMASTTSNLLHHRGAYYTILRPTSRRPEEKCLEDLYKETYDALYGSAASPIAQPIIFIDHHHPLTLPEQQNSQIHQQQQTEEIPLVAAVPSTSTIALHPGNSYLNVGTRGPNLPPSQPFWTSPTILNGNYSNPSLILSNHSSAGSMTYPILLTPSYAGTFPAPLSTFNVDPSSTTPTSSSSTLYNY